MSVMKLLAVEELFRSRGRIIGSVFLLKPDDAIELILECKARGIPVFGAEGFSIVGDKIQPSMEHSISGIDADLDRHQVTISFLRSHSKLSYWFEVMVEGLRG